MTPHDPTEQGIAVAAMVERIWRDPAFKDVKSDAERREIARKLVEAADRAREGRDDE